MNRERGSWLPLGLVVGVLGITGCGQTEISLLTYNVAGVPERLSTLEPQLNAPLISPLLNGYELVLLQEDFVYHRKLASAADHPYQLPPARAADMDEPGVSIPSGLSRLSQFPIDRVNRERWEACHGLLDSASDCVARKGFSVARHEVDLGSDTVTIDVYNLHMDAGSGPQDRAARQAQIGQLAEAIASRSSHHATVVAGDTNLTAADEPLLDRLLRDAELLDACRELGCPEPERIDRVLYRSSPWVSLKATRWRLPEEFVNADSAPLSDHAPVAVDFAISTIPAGLFDSGSGAAGAGP